MAVCIAILDRNSTPLKLMTNDPTKEVNFHYIVHTSLDVISERCSSNTPSVAVNVKSVETTRDQYLGILYSTEQHKVFGYITNVSSIFVSFMQFWVNSLNIYKVRPKYWNDFQIGVALSRYMPR